MGRKVRSTRKEDVLQAVRDHDGKLQAAAVARLLNLHPQEVNRTLAALEDEAEKYLFEDDRGFLGIFKR